MTNTPYRCPTNTCYSGYLLSGACVYYSLTTVSPVFGINYGDNLNVIIQKIENYMSSGTNKPIIITTNSDVSYTIPQDKLLAYVVVIPTSPLSSFSIGNTNGSGDVVPTISVNNTTPFNLSIYGTNNTIYFNGITSFTTLKIYLL